MKINILSVHIFFIITLTVITAGQCGRIGPEAETGKKSQDTTRASYLAIKWQWPLQSLRLTSFFGESRIDHFHDGIDISSYIGRVKPISAGRIIYMNRPGKKPFTNSLGPGRWCAILHKNGLVSTYMHLSKLNSNISKRKILEKDIIGLSGNSGRSLGAHLHFTILDPVGKTIYNPLILLPGVKDEVKPEIQNLVVRSGHKRIIIPDGETITLEKPFILTVQITDRLLKSEMRRKMGIYILKSTINGLEGPSYRFDQITFWKSVQKSGQKDFFEIYQDGKGYIISKGNLPTGENSVKIRAEDFFGNHSTRTFKFHIKYK